MQGGERVYLGSSGRLVGGAAGVILAKYPGGYKLTEHECKHEKLSVCYCEHLT